MSAYEESDVGGDNETVLVPPYSCFEAFSSMLKTATPVNSAISMGRGAFLSICQPILKAPSLL